MKEKKGVSDHAGPRARQRGRRLLSRMICQEVEAMAGASAGEDIPPMKFQGMLLDAIEQRMREWRRAWVVSPDGTQRINRDEALRLYQELRERRT